jgi:hypothetical protein
LQTKLSENPIHTPFANGETGLAQLLSDDLGTGFRVQEAMANRLADQLLAASIVGFGSAALTEQGDSSLIQEGFSQLKVALPTKTELSGGLARTERSTFAGDEHRQFQTDLVLWGKGQRATGTDKFFQGYVEGWHGVPPEAKMPDFGAG